MGNSIKSSVQVLLSHYDEIKNIHMRDLFAQNMNRFSEMSLSAAGLFLDYSKNRITQQTVSLLCDLAESAGVAAYRDKMFSGEKINNTENRAVLHTALRAPAGKKIISDGQNVSYEVHGVLNKMFDFSERVHSGKWLGYTGKPITDVVNIGIGGSYLGPRMVCEALRPYASQNLRMHFVSNVDGHDLDSVLSRISPETSLFIIASKTFTTLETMLNAHSARVWFLRSGKEKDLANHFVAVSTNTEAVRAFGIDTRNMFEFWDWVGGRYSVWSAIGLPVVLSLGSDGFKEFLAGAYEMDEHFLSAPFEKNMPVLFALVGIWNRNFLGCSSFCVAPYHNDLARFTDYLQQLEMESNGKSVTRLGGKSEMATCPVLWGNIGTNGQHAYFQLLHQGTDVVPVDFIAALRAKHNLTGHHSALLANCFAQSEAFMRGKSAEEVREELKQKGMDSSDAAVAHRVFEGNRPSNTILLEELNPKSLGALIALYEHKTFVQGVIWNLNSFDQWGVELGKVLAKSIQDELEWRAESDHDSSTSGLIAYAKRVGKF